MPKNAPRMIARGVNSAISCEAGTKCSNFSGLVSAIATSKPATHLCPCVGPAAMLRRTWRPAQPEARGPAGGIPRRLVAAHAVEVCRGRGAHLDPSSWEVLAPAAGDQRRRVRIGAQLAREARLQP